MNMALAQALPGVAKPIEVQAVVSAPSDEALLRSIAGGEQQAMRILFSRHNVAVYRFALSITRDRSLAEEVVSDVFFAVWRRAGSFKGRSRVSTWLMAIARYKAIASWRKHARDRANDELADTLVAFDPETEVQSKQPGTALAACLQQLSTIHREIIDLVYYHQKSIVEVAEILRIPVNTVKTRLFYARRGIARALGMQDATSRSLSW
jgi:RNA polymerase sigma-70 factor (ECF subfamily)